MSENHTKLSTRRQIRLLILDDSLMFRRFLRELLVDRSTILIVGEAANGLEGIELLNTCRPDVILMDMEMPIMDGMSALQHIMLHRPTPILMLSSISREGTARCFDALKNGAVDFLGKDQLHPGKGLEALKNELVYRIIRASKVKVQSKAMIRGANNHSTAAPSAEPRVVFCEDCGARNIIDPGNGDEQGKVACRQCGDLLEAIDIPKYRRVSYIGVIGAGRGSTVNLLTIISRLPAEMSGALIVVLHETYDHIDSFVRYLKEFSSINVVRLNEGMNIEGGNCYIASSADCFHMVAHSTNYTIRQSIPEPGQGPLDLLINSIAAIVKSRIVALVLSGEQLEGVRGFQRVKQSGGTALVLNSASCLCKEMGENILKKCSVDKIVDDCECINFLLQAQETASYLKGTDAVGRTG